MMCWAGLLSRNAVVGGGRLPQLGDKQHHVGWLESGLSPWDVAAGNGLFVSLSQLGLCFLICDLMLGHCAASHSHEY